MFFYLSLFLFLSSINFIGKMKKLDTFLLKTTPWRGALFLDIKQLSTVCDMILETLGSIFGKIFSKMVLFWKVTG